MKKKVLLVYLLLIMILPLNVKALSLDKNNITLASGTNKNIDLYANVDTEVSEISFTLTYTTYDIPAYLNLEQGLTDTNPNGITHKIIFSNPVSGKIKLGSIRVDIVSNPKVNAGTININGASATTTNGNRVNLNAQTLNVTIGEPAPEEPIEKKTNLLEKIESEIVKIDLQKDVYEYTVKIKENIKELDLKAIAKDENYKVEISSQKISELKDNKIIITVKDGDNKEEYVIKVDVEKEKEKEVNELEIDEEEFESTYKYKGKWITLIIIMSVVLVVGLFLTKKK